jgi:hypothetical protein
MRSISNAATVNLTIRTPTVFAPLSYERLEKVGAIEKPRLERNTNAKPSKRWFLSIAQI